MKKFVSWCRALISSPKEVKEAINDRYIYEPIPVSSFKHRAEYIKRRYNHRFKKPAEDNFMEGIRDLDKFFF